MSQPPAARSFTLTPRPPLRAFAITAIVDVVGLLLLIAGQTSGQVFVVVSGVVLVVMGGLVLSAALLANSRLHSVVIVDDRGITITRAKQTRTVTWSDVTGVHLSATHLVIDAPEGKGAAVVNPLDTTSLVVSDLASEINRRLDADRGYTDFVG